MISHTQNLRKDGDGGLKQSALGSLETNGFLPALESFPATSADDPSKDLVDLWNGKMYRAEEITTPKCPLP